MYLSLLLLLNKSTATAPKRDTAVTTAGVLDTTLLSYLSSTDNLEDPLRSTETE